MTGTTRTPWKAILAPYTEPCARRGSAAIVTSVLPYLALTVAMYLLYTISPLLSLVLLLPAAGFLVRTFVVFHDCAHGSLLPSRRANAIFGNILGVLVLAPYAAWRHEHAVHHATHGDLDRRGTGDVETLTVREYNERGWGGRFAYRAFRNPLIMFGLGPIFAMIIRPRLISADMRPRIRNSILANDLALAVVGVAVGWLFGWWQLLIIWLPTAMIAGAAGIFLFYVQHQFEDAYWERGDDWSYYDAALRGSSYLKLPAILNFFSANIGFHHLHHLNARIPSYHLPEAHRSSPDFAKVPTLTMLDGVRCVRYKLWDEQSRRMVGFAEARASLRAGQAATA
ncbi:MAG: fatty acid desaturase [Solirubrobacterales bacterium]|nr:fatty acid desaturase [Solirubrobacterales bacterium]